MLLLPHATLPFGRKHSCQQDRIEQVVSRRRDTIQDQQAFIEMMKCPSCAALAEVFLLREEKTARK